MKGCHFRCSRFARAWRKTLAGLANFSLILPLQGLSCALIEDFAACTHPSFTALKPRVSSLYQSAISFHDGETSPQCSTPHRLPIQRFDDFLRKLIKVWLKLRCGKNCSCAKHQCTNLSTRDAARTEDRIVSTVINVLLVSQVCSFIRETVLLHLTHT